MNSANLPQVFSRQKVPLRQSGALVVNPDLTFAMNDLLPALAHTPLAEEGGHFVVPEAGAVTGS